MRNTALLHQLLDASASLHGQRIAVEDLDGHGLSYRELDAAAGAVCSWLQGQGVTRGDRVGICLPKSIDSVIAIFGILRSGAAYVPVDASAPAERNAYVFDDCGVRQVIAAAALSDGLRRKLSAFGNATPILEVADDCDGTALVTAIKAASGTSHAGHAEPTDAPGTADDLAYILYTSGSTGRPKGVMISHRSALAFIDWCSGLFEPTELDRFSSHAPFHFDLSIFDLYVSLKHGARVVLIGERASKDPTTLVRAIEDKGLTIWYSTPSILSLMVQYGSPDQADASTLRMVLFAGEVFPIKHLRALKALWPQPRFFNLYGPTETNVCTWYEVPRLIEAARLEPYPIGGTCAHYEARVVDERGQPVACGAEGELCMRGPGVMQGYWNLPDRTAAAFLDAARQWYRTGDLVREDEQGNYSYLGRRDRMVKRRGYRVELGEIESCLYRHDAIEEAAVVAIRDADHGVTVRAFVRPRSGEKLSIIKLKKFCTEHLPAYMVPDTFVSLADLPKTSTDKTDYQKLMELG